jgi:hypothetical protein
MSKGEKRCGLDATVGGLGRIVQPFRVAINAKGGDCWHVYRRVCLSLMERKTMMMERTTMMMENRKEMMIAPEEVLFYEDRAQEEKSKTRPFNRFHRRRLRGRNL